jgi:hypothetical protein
MLWDDVMESDSVAMMIGDMRGQFVRHMYQAGRFNLSPEFAFATNTIRDKNPEAAFKAKHLLKLPTSPCWIECVNHERGWTQKTRQDLPPVHRVGVLMTPVMTRYESGGIFQGPEAGIFAITLFWNFAKGIDMPANMSALDIVCEFADEAPFIAQEAEAFDLVGKHEWAELARLYGFAPYPCHYLDSRVRKNMHTPHGQLPRHVEDAVTTLVDAAHTDWEAEAGFWPLVLLMIHSRNISYVDAPAPGKLETRKAKRLGVRPEQVVFRTCHMKMDRIYRRHAGGLSDREAMRRHLVVGHWKVRRTGVFYWSPFYRGDRRKGDVVKDYVLEGPDADD